MSYLKNFYYQLYGDPKKPKLVFLHGLMGMGSNWRKILGELEKDYEILTYDQRGHGRSFHPESGYGPYDYAQDLLKIIDELGWSKINLVGHSMGGRAALAFAIEYEHRLEKLVIEDISPKSDWRSAEKLIDLVESVPVPFESRKEAREYFRHDFLEGAEDQGSRKRLGDFFYLNIGENKSTGRASWRFYKKAIIESLKESRLVSLWEGFGAVTCPLLIVRGELSTDLPQENYDKMLSGNSHAQGVVIEGAGHWVHAEKPRLFVNSLKDFL